MEIVETTGPAFWLRPVWSTEWVARPSILAAAASIWLTVTTPVPPMPGMRRVAPAAGTMRVGSGRLGAVQRRRRDAGARPPPLASLTVTKAGQSPLRQLTSRLQLAWSMVVLRPNSVSIGCRLKQLDLTPQSPQPSHTRSSIIEPEVGRGQQAPLAVPALLRRALLVVDEHRHARHRPQVLLGLDDAVPVQHLGALGHGATPRYFPRSSVVMMISCTPSCRSLVATSGTGRRPVASWPAGHGHRGVVEELEGDVDAGRHGGLHGELAGVEERAVADVLEQVRVVDERGDADPLAALAAHLGDAGDRRPAIRRP